jgi:outer membrane receptor protein involved in Fe transport
MVRKKQLSGAIALAVAMTMHGEISFAQESQRVTLEEIVVTARKRIESLQETPLAISAFTSNTIQANNIKDITDIAQMTSGFSFNAEFGRSESDRPVIRGQATILGASGVSTFIDGVLITGSVLDYDLSDVERIEVIKGPQAALYGRNTYSGAINITTKAPQDEMTGNLSVDVGTFEGRGGLDQTDISGAIRGPLTESISGGLTGRHYKRSGPFDNVYDGTETGDQESHSVSGALYFDVTDNLEIRTRLRWSKLNDDQPRLFSTAPEQNNCVGPDTGGVYLGNFRYFCGELEEQPIAVDDRRLFDEQGSTKTESWESSVAIEYALNDEWTLLSITGYNTSDKDAKADFGHDTASLAPFATFAGVFDPDGPGPAPVSSNYVVTSPLIDFGQDIELENTDFSTELQLQFEGDTWNGLVGAYYYYGEEVEESVREAPTDFDSIVAEAYALQEGRVAIPIPGFPLNNLGNPLAEVVMEADRDKVELDRENVAIFGMVEHEFTDRLSLSVEARFSSETIESKTVQKNALYQYGVGFLGFGNVENVGVFGADMQPVLGAPVVTKRKEVFRNINPRISGKYALTDDVNIYAVIATGNKPGGFNDAKLESFGTGSYDEETVLSYELGAKTTLLDGRMTFNAAVYNNTIEDYQLTESVAGTGFNGSAIKNAGEVRIRGIELETVFTPESLPDLILSANYAYSDSEFLKGSDLNEGKLLDVMDDGRNNCSTGVNDPSLPCGSDGGNVAFGSITGRELPNSAKNMANIGASYSIGLNDSWSLLVNGNVAYEGKRWVQVHNRAWVGASTFLNASIALENESFRLALWGKNLTDEDALASGIRYASGTNSFQRMFLGSPRVGRQYGLTGSYMF